MVTNDFQYVFSCENLAKAWKWILSNPDARYKRLFSSIYSAYALSDKENLKFLSQKILDTNYYEPNAPIKFYLPKPSGLLRNYTLISVEDQIIYQAITNLIAEKYYPKAKKHFNKKCFGHLYAGKKSKFFYKKWQDGYKSFCNNLIQANESGLD